MYTENTKDSRSYNVKEVTQLLGVNKDTVGRMIKDGRLEAEKVGRAYQISEASIVRLVKEGSNK